MTILKPKLLADPNKLAIEIGERFVLLHDRHDALIDGVLTSYRDLLQEELRTVNAEIRSRNEKPSI